MTNTFHISVFVGFIVYIELSKNSCKLVPFSSMTNCRFDGIHVEHVTRQQFTLVACLPWMFFDLLVLPSMTADTFKLCCLKRLWLPCVPKCWCFAAIIRIITHDIEMLTCLHHLYTFNYPAHQICATSRLYIKVILKQ